MAGPYRFYQVLWLYTQFSECEWSILLLPYGKGDKVVNDIHAKCDKLGIFNKIYHSNMVRQDSGWVEQAIMFAKMFVYYIVGKKKVLMKKNILSQTEGEDFDVFFVGCEYSIIEGAIIGLAEEKEVYIFEEGMSDYIPRKKYPSFSIKEIFSFIVTKMGYFSPYQTFEMKNIKLCTKYSSLPNALWNRGYEKVIQLFGKEEKEYKELLNSIYDIDNINIENSDVILFTTVLNENIESDKHYIQSVHDWLVKNYKNKRILIKKHPRDQAAYDWKDLDCRCMMESVPAEVLSQYVTNQEVVLMRTSTALISLLKRTSNVYMLFPDDGVNNTKNRAETIRILNLDKERMIYL